MKTDCQIGYRESLEFVQALDKIADSQGLNRSNFLRKVVRDAIKHSEEYA